MSTLPPTCNQAATMHIRPGLENASISACPGTPGLVQVTAERHRPDIRRPRDGHRVTMTVQFPRVTFSRTSPSQLVLDTEPLWEITVDGGVSQSELCLDALSLAALRVSGGIAATRIDLPRPRTTVPILLGDCTDVTIDLPDTTAARVAVERGAHGLQIGSQHIAACKGPTAFEIGDPDTTTELYDIRIRSANRTAVSQQARNGEVQSC